MRRSTILLLLLLLPSALLADEVYIKGAGKLSGRIVDQTADKVTVDVGNGTIGVSMKNVDRIVKSRTPLDDFDDRARQLGPRDVEGWKALGRWASKQGLPAQAREAYEKVVTLAPNDAEANGALGLVQLNGRWITKEESYRAQGYVRYQGEWMSPGEAQAAQASDAAHRARQEAEGRANQAAAATAQAKAQEAQDRAKEAEDRAKEADDTTQYYGPGYWGVPYWPPTTAPKKPQGARPAQLPARRGGR